MTFLGANWRTSVSGYLETVCVIVIALCALPTDVWTNPRVWIPATALVIAKTIKDTLTKDKNVTGGNIQQTSDGSVAGNKAQKESVSVQDTQTATKLSNGHV
jgi:hypothetical protein